MMNLRLAESKDVEALVHLGRETYQQHFSAIWSVIGLQSYLDEHFTNKVISSHVNTRGILYFFIQDDDVPVGLLKLKLGQRIPAPPFDHGMELEKIYLLASFTGKGFGTYAINEAISLSQQTGSAFVWLDVLKSNEQAKNLYSRFGFQTVGEIAFSTDISKIDMWILRRDIK
jgi:diamine N-acetyltransferase